jgi:hypothetical protein
MIKSLPLVLWRPAAAAARPCWQPLASAGRGGQRAGWVMCRFGIGLRLAFALQRRRQRLTGLSSGGAVPGPWRLVAGGHAGDCLAGGRVQVAMPWVS